MLIKKSSIEERSDIISRPLTQKIRCKCGAAYTPLSVNGKQYWGCKIRNFDSEKCDSHRIPEKDIYDAFITMVNKLRKSAFVIFSRTVRPHRRRCDFKEQ